MKLKLQFIIAIFIALVVYIPAVQAQANLTFSGGNNSSITITLLEPVTYTIINGNCALGGAQPSTGPVFVFDEAGNPFLNPNPFTTVASTSTIRYSINGGALQPITTVNSGRAPSESGDRTFFDIYAFGNQQPLLINTTVVLYPGTITTNGNFSGTTLPANGNYSTFITRSHLKNSLISFTDGTT